MHQAYLARNDFLRAALYLQESAISAECYRLKLDSNTHLQREEARASLKANPAFNSLSDIRNMLAHGTDGTDTTRAAAAKSATATASGLANRLRQLGKDLQR